MPKLKHACSTKLRLRMNNFLIWRFLLDFGLILPSISVIFGRHSEIIVLYRNFVLFRLIISGRHRDLHFIWQLAFQLAVLLWQSTFAFHFISSLHFKYSHLHSYTITYPHTLIYTHIHSYPLIYISRELKYTIHIQKSSGRNGVKNANECKRAQNKRNKYHGQPGS